METPRRVTVRDLAAAAGVSIATVSLALRDNPRIRTSTKDRVRAAARRLGYRPDPMVSALAAYRARIRPHPEHAVLAFVNSYRNPRLLQTPWLKAIYEGVRKEGRELGYQVQHFHLRREAGGPAAASRILFHRGVQGLLIGPMEETDGALDLDWARFSAVSIGRTLVRPALHAVGLDHLAASLLAVERLLASGYRRIGMVLPEAEDRRLRHRWLAGYRIAQERAGRGVRLLAPALLDPWGERTVLAWLRRSRPDAILTLGSEVPGWLRAAGWKIPDRIGVANLVKQSGTDAEAGILENLDAVGEGAVRMLHGLILRGERGVPGLRHTLLVDAVWSPGGSVRDAPITR
jgi:DNA-binding LacI/PurR family transcriptional regulator